MDPRAKKISSNTRWMLAVAAVVAVGATLAIGLAARDPEVATPPVAGPASATAATAQEADPALSGVPGPRVIPAPAPGGDPNLVVALGYEFSFPWPALAKNEKAFGGVRLVSEQGKGVLVRALLPPVDWDAQFPGADPAVRRSLEDLAARSGYSFYEAVLAATPQARARATGVEEARLGILLVLKDAVASAAGGRLYSFETKDVRGFQMGDPGGSQSVQVYAFAKEGNGLALIFYGPKGGAPPTQAEIDQALATLRPVSAAAPATKQ